MYKKERRWGKLNFIVFDLEWNQCPHGKEKSVEGIPFEIIEIGAIKLNEKMEMIDQYAERIKPQIYKEIDRHVGLITHLTMKDLEKCRQFQEVVSDFINWCGDSPVFCTWGPLDLIELQRNLEYYKLPAIAEKPFFYYDVQKLFAIFFEENKETKTLAYAVEYFHIKQEAEFHSAINDAKYTAQVFQKFDSKKIKKYQELDYFNYPKRVEDEVYISFASYSKSISKAYPSRETLMGTRKVREVLCCICQKKAGKKVDWFSNNSKNYYGLFYCKDHGYLKGKLRIKRGREEDYFSVKTIKIISKEEAKNLRQHKADVLAKKMNGKEGKV